MFRNPCINLLSDTILHCYELQYVMNNILINELNWLMFFKLTNKYRLNWPTIMISMNQGLCMSLVSTKSYTFKFNP